MAWLIAIGVAVATAAMFGAKRLMTKRDRALVAKANAERLASAAKFGSQSAADHINQAYRAALERGAPLKPKTATLFEPKALIAAQRATRRRSIRPLVKAKERTNE